MSVKIIDNEAFYGFRVRRTVDGRLYQEYFSLKKSGKRLGKRQTRSVEKLAEARDDHLRLEQEKARRRRKAERCFHPDGRVKGISYLIKTEKSGTKTPIFQVGIASELEGRVVCTSFSINAHGLDRSWGKAVDTFARHKKISSSSKLYRSLLAARPEVDVPLDHLAGDTSQRMGRNRAVSRRRPTKHANESVSGGRAATQVGGASEVRKKKDSRPGKSQASGGA